MKTTMKAMFFALLFTYAGATCVLAQWTSIKSMGTGPNDGCFSFTILGKGYAGAGTNSSNFYEYDTSTGNWTFKGSAPGNKNRGFSFSFAANGKGFVGTGDSTGGNNLCSDVWMYDPSTNAWTQKNNFPGGPRAGVFCFAINNIAYIGGGNDINNVVLNDFYKYDPATDIWTPLGTLPFGPIAFPSTFTIANKGYVATGAVAALSECKSLWEYNPIGNTWTQKMDFPGIARQAGFGFALGNFGYVGAGASGFTNIYNDMWKYNPVLNSWSPEPAFPSLYPGWTTSFTIGNSAYAGAGAYFNSTGFFATDSFKRFRGPDLTGIDELGISETVMLYPNPVVDYLTIPEYIEMGAAISVTDMNGREIKTFRKTAEQLYIGDLPSGIYLLNHKNNTDKFCWKILKE